MAVRPFEMAVTDEDIKAVKAHGPMTRARAKRFKEGLNNLVQRVLHQESIFTTKGERRLVLLIKFDSEEEACARGVTVYWACRLKVDWACRLKKLCFFSFPSLIRILSILSLFS